MTNQEAIDLLDNLIGMIEDNHGSDYDSAIRMAINALKNLHEIIRCKDCRFYEFKQGSLPWNNSRRYCNRSVALSTQENDYCSYAELRGDLE